MGGVLPCQNSKCQDLPTFEFLGRRWGGGVGVLPSHNSKCQDLPKFQGFFLGGGVGMF